MVDAPLNIRRFETLQLVSICVGLVNLFATVNRGLFSAVMGAALFIVFTLLISRGRKNWARWVLLGISALGATYAVWWHPPDSLGYVPLTAVVWLMQAVALVLVFTPQSSTWLRTAPVQA